jgi:dTDP-glucose 4,6-dehydratase
MTLNACEGKPLPIYSDDGNVRDWLYVIDHCEGLLHTLHEGQPGEKYNIGGNCELTNIELVDALCGALEELRPAAENASLKGNGVANYTDLKPFVPDRPGHDRRYAIDARKIEHELGWQPRFSLVQGLMATVRWFVENPSWCTALQAQTAEGSARSHQGLKRQA